MTVVSTTLIRDRVGDLILQTFGTGPYGNLTPAASGGVVTFPSGYRIVYAVGDGQAKIAQLQQGVDVAASDNDEVHAVVVDDEITAIEAAASTPAGSQRLGVATGSPVDTFTQDDRAGGIVIPAASTARSYSLIFALLKNFGAAATSAVGEHARLDIVDAESGDIAVTTGGNDQTDGLITLPAGKVFLCQAWVRAESIATSDFLQFQWRNNTDAVLFGGESAQTGDTGTAAKTSLDTCAGIIDTSAGAKEIELRFTARSAGGVTYSGRSYAIITEIG